MNQDLRIESALIQLRGVRKSFVHLGETIRVLQGVSVSAEVGATVAVMGPSGSGKTTLLHLIAGLERVDEGEIWVQDRPIHAMKAEELTRWRNEKLGLIYQQHLLIEELTALENVMIRCLIAGYSPAEAESRSRDWLERVGLADRLSHYPVQLSGGEAQRVAIARALVVEPSLILADEPTGNLDEETGERVFGLMLDLVRETGATLITATHNRALAERCRVLWHLQHGRVVVTAAESTYPARE